MQVKVVKKAAVAAAKLSHLQYLSVLFYSFIITCDDKSRVNVWQVQQFEFQVNRVHYRKLFIKSSQLLRNTCSFLFLY
jgi:hypothetical protein